MTGWQASHGTAYVLFEEQVRRRPGALALDGDGARLRYAEVAERAERYAAVLRAHGAGPETVVGVHLRDRLDTVLCVLGIWRAGAAFVAAGPRLPPRRRELVLRETAAPIVVTDDPAALDGSAATLLPPVPAGPAHLPARPSLDVLRSAVLRSDGPRSGPERPPAVPGSGGDLAYVCYTSGSTGLPKGALIEQAGVVSLALGLREVFGDMSGARVLQFAPLTFDVWIWELVISLLAGATLVLPPGGAGDGPSGAGTAGDELAGDELAAVLRDRRVTCFSAAPSLLAGLPEDLPTGLTTLVSGGEPLPPELVRRWGRRVRLINAYGPTEATVCATAGVCVPGDGTEPPGIGRPLSGVEVRLLRPDGEPVPDGERGELCVAGPQVARGYLARPELTARAFGTAAPAAFPASAPGARVYRTGDLARWAPDGTLRFAGRLDRQIKLRGFRIEPGEVEEALRAHPAVAVAAVTAVGEGRAHRRLAAYLQLRPGAALTVERLRAFLRPRLPAHMIPSLVHVVDRLPLNGHGKVDHARLPALPRSRPPLAHPPVATSGGYEPALAALWEDLLMVEGIGATDGFFELGGTSADLLTLRSRIEERWGVRPGVADLARAHTVRLLAGLLDRRRAHASPHPDPAPGPPPSRRERAGAVRRLRDRHDDQRPQGRLP
ncbi:amino acid adenylation domain-containing protein [Actinomadura viridis]|uniref:non-ribosomal peptide synthetase n=1 Tax=Actinomadura viridis TaxID=58110 RepID=UPI0036792C76